MDTLTLDRVAAKVEAGEPLSEQDIQQLASTHDILTLGSLADGVRRRRHGAATTFVRVAEFAIGRAGDVPVRDTARELRIVGVVDSETNAYEAVRRAAAASGGVPVSGFSLAWLETLAGGEAARLEAVLGTLRAEGLGMLAEAPIDALKDWKRALGAAAAAGLRVPRLTVDAASQEVLPLLERVVEAHREFGEIGAVAPIPRHPGPQPTTGYEDVKAVALMRIVLDVHHIQVDWRLHGPKLAQVALTVGASDVDNVSAEEDETTGRRRSPLEEILRNIRAAGLKPVERDAGFTRPS